MCGLNCCSPKGDGSIIDIYVDGNKISFISLNTLKSDTTIIPLSSLVEYCDYVQLEYTEESLFNPWMTTISDKYIGIIQERAPYKLFDRSGKFLCNVGSVGQGPGEYSTLYDDFIDEKNELLYLAPFIGNKIFVYSTSGKFLKEIVAPQRLICPRLFLSEDILTVIQMPVTEDNALAIQFNVTSGQVLNELVTPSHLIVQNYEEAVYNSRNIPTIFDMIHTCSDTLYHFDVISKKIIPVFAMKYESAEKIHMRHFQLNKDLIMTFVFNKGLVANDLINRTTSWVKVVNDYFGNMVAPTTLVNFRNGYYVHNIQPDQLIEDIGQRLTESNCTEEYRQILLKTLSTLKEDENNVVFIGKLKSEVKKKLW